MAWSHEDLKDVQGSILPLQKQGQKAGEGGKRKDDQDFKRENTNTLGENTEEALRWVVLDNKQASTSPQQRASPAWFALKQR